MTVLVDKSDLGGLDFLQMAFWHVRDIARHDVRFGDKVAI
jgi:hypothetical protein